MTLSFACVISWISSRTYMLGSNADLPIVGGSILSHDHFQGGNYHFPMDAAPVRIPLTAPSDAR